MSGTSPPFWLLVENTYSFETYCDNFLTAFISSFSSLAAHFIINFVSHFCVQAAKEVVLSYFPKYEYSASKIHVRVAELPLRRN